ncbi:hypothetical protein N5079_23785 [Planotetraspora sp. A-T 1434]|uniref:hypothetical protein n=1 Tax=Planotetraspora sp. A-T 1434 TaxID=2979219 RepID=UPI0021BF7733|nr:hypothetical protein [Planotetraspora sp. A-T 1434]MCT9933236.1 hypothetical protein [Planotetraspora sp. A-T 1434]
MGARINKNVARFGVSVVIALTGAAATGAIIAGAPAAYADETGATTPTPTPTPPPVTTANNPWG